MSTPTEIDLLRSLAEKLHSAGWGKRSKVMETFARSIGKKPQWVYQRMKALGIYESGRKRRADAGKCLAGRLAG